MTVLSVAPLTLAAVNAIFIVVATMLDARRSSALARALGVTPRLVSFAASAGQLLPALPGAVLGIPAGIGLHVAVSNGGAVTMPPCATTHADFGRRGRPTSTRIATLLLIFKGLVPGSKAP